MTTRSTGFDSHLMAMGKLPMLHFYRWHTPATDLPRQEIDGWRIRQIRYTPGYYNFYGLGGYGLFRVERSIPITLLEERRGKRWHTWMVDDPPHWYAMQRYARIAHGRVFMGGLGLGLALNTYLANPRVGALTVVDRAWQVQDLVPLPSDSRLSFQRGDVLEVATYHAQRGVEYDHVFLDLWVANGNAEKEWLTLTAVAPMVAAVRGMWPHAQVLVHGFWRYTTAAKLLLPTADFSRMVPADTKVTFR